MRRIVPVAVNEHTSITDGITAQYFEFGDEAGDRSSFSGHRSWCGRGAGVDAIDVQLAFWRPTDGRAYVFERDCVVVAGGAAS